MSKTFAIRSILAIVSGYVLFAGSAVLLFALAGRDPHASADAGFTAIAIAYGACFGILSGYVAARLAPRWPYVHALSVGILIALGALISFIARPGLGQLWTQISTILIFAPLTIFGAMLRRKSRTAGSSDASVR